jgi:hypothetical protein
VKTILILMFSGWSLFAQTTNTNQITNTNEVRTGLVTNWVEPGPYLRVVNGQIYNTAYSKLWGSPIELIGGFPTLANNGHPIKYEVIAEQIENGKIFCSIYAITYWWETWTGVEQDEFREPVKTIVVYHYLGAEKLVTGEAFRCHCMRTTNYVSKSGISYTAFDCGIQSTNLVPVVKKVKIKQ